MILFLTDNLLSWHNIVTYHDVQQRNTFSILIKQLWYFASVIHPQYVVGLCPIKYVHMYKNNNYIIKNVCILYVSMHL